MERIKEISQLSAKLPPYFKKGIFTNNYRMAEEYRSDIEEKNLYFQESEAGLLLLHDRENHWRISYYLKDREAEFLLPEEKPCVMEVLWRDRDSEEKYLPAIEYWRKRGLQTYLYRSRMKGTAGGFSAAESCQDIRYAQLEEAGVIRELISQEFDPYLGCIPSLLEMEESIEKKRILCYTQSNAVMGVLHMEKVRTLHVLWHLAVSPQVRNQGVAKKLLSAFRREALESDETNHNFQLWVKKDNLPARHLYEAAGFQYDGWQSIGLILQRKNEEKRG